MSTSAPVLGPWERASHRLLQALRLERVQSRVLVFSLLSTLVPALTMSWHSYVVNREFVNEKTAEELQNATVHAAREFNLWLRERLYETRVFSSSYEVTENLEYLLRAREDARAAEARRRLGAYLESVKSRFPDYDDIRVVGLDEAAGRDAGAQRAVAARLPRDWVKQIRADGNVVGEAYWDDRRGRFVMTIAVPIRAASGRLLGVMAGTLNFHAVDRILKSFVVGRSGRVHLVDRDGVVIISSSASGVNRPSTRLPARAVPALGAEEGASLTYADRRDGKIVASVRRVSPGWAAVAEIRYDEAYGRVLRTRNLTLLVLAAVVLGIGLAAYLLASTIVRPLRRLTAGADRVSAGDLEVDLPVVDRGEVGHLTRAFNHMVARLREGRDELAAVNMALGEMNRDLKRLSITDSLTGLYNHGHLQDTLQLEMERARRLKHFFSIVMIDVDNFKHYNDSRGHPAGDQLLSGIALLIKTSIRSIDYAARYGGDEFVVLLHEIDTDGARRLAERIRESLARSRWNQASPKVTVSMGIATFPDHGDNPHAIIASADAALYEAKRHGRDRIVASPRTGKRRPSG